MQEAFLWAYPTALGCQPFLHNNRKLEPFFHVVSIRLNNLRHDVDKPEREKAPPARQESSEGERKNGGEKQTQDQTGVV